MTKKPSISRLIELQKLLLAFQAIQRASRIPSEIDRHENDVEHSYFLAMMAWFLAPHFPHLNADRMIRLALAHDLVEVHSGDTFVYGDQTHLDSKADRETAAIQQLAKDWPDFTAAHQSIREYAEKSSEEAKFVYALDKMLPPIINYLAGGKVWHEHAVTIDMFKREKEKKIPKDSPIYTYYQEILEFFQTKPELFNHG